GRNLRRVDTCRRGMRPPDSPMRQPLPAAIALLPYSLEPDRRQARRVRGISVLWYEQADVSAPCDRHVAVHLDLRVVEIMNEILLVRDTLHERGTVVLNAARLLSACPSVPMTEMEVARQHRLREADVSPHHGGFDLLLES